MWSRKALNKTRLVGIAIISAGLVHCSAENSEEVPLGTAEDSIRNGTPVLVPQTDTVVSVQNGSLGFGSGSLIAGNWVLTAAHAVDPRRTRASNITVRWG